MFETKIWYEKWRETGSFPTSFDLITPCERLSKSPSVSEKCKDTPASNFIYHKTSWRFRRNSNYTRANEKSRNFSRAEHHNSLRSRTLLRDISREAARRLEFCCWRERENHFYDRSLYHRAWETRGGKWQGDGETFVRCQPSVRYGP